MKLEEIVRIVGNYTCAKNERMFKDKFISHHLASTKENIRYDAIKLHISRILSNGPIDINTCFYLTAKDAWNMITDHLLDIEKLESNKGFEFISSSEIEFADTKFVPLNRDVTEPALRYCFKEYFDQIPQHLSGYLGYVGVFNKDKAQMKVLVENINEVWMITHIEKLK